MKRFFYRYFERFENQSFRSILVVVWIIITGFFGYQLPSLKPDFEFEKFFPTNDPDIAFYNDHLEVFGYDNDFLLVILENENGIFDSLFLSKVNNATHALENASFLNQVVSPTNIHHLVAGPMGVTPFPLIHLNSPTNFSQDSTQIMSHPFYRSLFGKDGTTLMIQIIHEHPATIEESKQIQSNVEGITSNAGLTQSRIVGKLTAQEEFISFIQKDFSRFLIAALILSFGILLLIFRSLKLALLPYLISVTSLVWLLGLMAFLGYPITIVGSLIPPVILFVSTSDAIHFINGFRSSNGLFTEKLKLAAQKVFVPTFLTSLTTAIGFLSLITITTEPIQHLGIFVGIGIVFAFLITFGFGPLMLTSDRKQSSSSLGIRFIPIWLLKHQLVVVLFSIVIVLVSGFGLTKLETDAYLLSDLPSSSKTKQDFNLVDDQFGGSKPWELAYWPTDSSKTIWDASVMNEANKIQSFLQNNHPIERLISPVSLIKYGNQMTNGGLNEAFQFPENANYSRSVRVIQTVVRRDQFVKLQDNSMHYGRFVGFIPQLGSKATNQQNEALRLFIEEEIDDSVITTRLTGTTYLIDKSHGLLTQNLFKGLVIAIGMISLVLGLYFKSLKVLTISMISNIIPIAFCAGIMGISGISLQLTTSIIFAVVFGIAVDDTIHFVSVYRKEIMQTDNRVFALVNTFRSAGKAIIFTTLILVGGFCLFLFSSFGATFYLGLFISVSLIIALLIDLTLLPILLHHFSNKLPKK